MCSFVLRPATRMRFFRGKWWKDLPLRGRDQQQYASAAAPHSLRVEGMQRRGRFAGCRVLTGTYEVPTRHLVPPEIRKSVWSNLSMMVPYTKYFDSYYYYAQCHVVRHIPRQWYGRTRTGGAQLRSS